MRIPYEACPLCEAKEASAKILEATCSRHKLYQQDLPPTISWLTCTSCGHVYTDGYWNPEALKLIFSKTHDNQKPCHDMEASRFVSADIIERVMRERDSLGSWLDVGFGNGSLMFTAAEYGFEVYGLDLRPENVAIMSSIGFNAREDDIVDFAADNPAHNRFGVVSMADCLEHMPFPKRGLEAARSLMWIGSCLFVSMPNMGAPLWGYLNQTNANDFWGEIEHYHNFSRERLYALLEETGFSVVSYGVSRRYRCCMEVVAAAI